ncbi:MAG: protein kinase [Elusimicrobia bacterium]|nr:protein kinase [Elusimicrobiota bacterium]
MKKYKKNFKKPQVIGYKINYHKKLGAGGNARVYLAVNKDGKEVAVKILKDKISYFEKKLKRFKTEVVKVREIQDKIKGVLPILDYSLEKPPYWYAMPIALPIKEHFENSKNIDDDNIGNKVKCVIELAESLSELHAKGICHRDIKPSNLYFYNGGFVLADFGLVSYEGKEDITSIKERVGNRQTMDPVMEANPKTADKKMADVYSLAKTLWLLLTDETGKKMGFKGTYLSENSEMGLSNYFKKQHLVELEEVLYLSTLDSQKERPNASEFALKLKDYIKIKNDDIAMCQSQWRFIYKSLFKGSVPQRAVFEDMKDIVNVLNMTARLPNINHSYFPDGGGDDFEKAEFAKEKDCIVLDFGASTSTILKPRRLIAEYFGKDYMFNYLRLEADELKPIFPPENSEEEFEYMIEDKPGNYVRSKYENYNRYDDKTLFPQGTRRIRRYLSGSFIITGKFSVYNLEGPGYSGTHNVMDSDTFRDYIKLMRDAYFYCSNVKDFKLFRNLCNIDFCGKNKAPAMNTVISPEDSDKLKKFMRDNCESWDFTDIICQYEAVKEPYIKFSIELGSISGSIFDIDKDKYYLSESGKFKKIDGDIGNLKKEKDRLFLKISSDDILKIEKQIEQTIEGILSENKFVLDWPPYALRIELFKEKNPTRIFTKEEIKKVLQNGDDFKDNYLIIDGAGCPRLVDSYDMARISPVVNEKFCAGNNYVGEFAPLEDKEYLDDTYLVMLSGLFKYLKTGKRHYVGDAPDLYPEKKLLEEITTLIKNQDNKPRNNDEKKTTA